MADNRITLTTWAAPQNDLTGDYGPITFKLALLGGKWDKTNRSNEGSSRGAVDLSNSEPKGGLPSFGKSSPEKRITNYHPFSYFVHC
jgi:hypothetical protein